MIVKKISFRFKRLSDSAEVIASDVLKTCPYSANDPNCKDFLLKILLTSLMWTPLQGTKYHVFNQVRYQQAVVYICALGNYNTCTEYQYNVMSHHD